MPRYVAFVTLRLPSFIISDIIATAQTLAMDLSFEDPTLRVGADPLSPFIVLNLNRDEDAISLASKCISIRTISRLIYDGPSLDSLFEFCRSYHHNFNDTSFRVQVETFRRRILDSERLDIIQRLINSLSITSKVDLKHAQTTIVIHIAYPEEKEPPPTHIFLGTFLTDGLFHFPDQFLITKRAFINTTTMEPAIALHSATQGLASKGKVVFDPFCGSGSILIAAASLGAFVIGSDLDFKSLVGTGEGPNVGSNFEQYGLSDHLIGFLRSDIMANSVNFARMPKFDAIVTDPPYGIREKCVSDSPSPLLPLLLRLYDVAVKYLKVGGRLVYWLPYPNVDFDPQELPSHPSLKLISNCRQKLMSRYSRHLLTFEKINDMQAEVKFDHPNAQFLNVRDIVLAPRDEFLTKEKKK